MVPEHRDRRLPGNTAVTWWLKTRLVHTVLTGGLLAFTALTLTFQDTAVLLPSLSINAGNTVVLASFTPLLIAGALAQCLDSRLVAAELTGTRPVYWMDTGLVTATMAVVTAVTWTGGTLLDSPAIHQTGRNTLFLTGLMLAARAFAGRAGIMAPLAWIFAVIFLGRRTATDFHPWAVTGLPIDTRHAAAAAALALVLGTVLNQLLHQRTARDTP